MTIYADLQAEEKIMAKKMNKEYAPISGIPEFTDLAIKIALGDDSPNLQKKSNATVQVIK